MTAKRVWRGKRENRGEPVLRPRSRPERRRWEHATYWLLYAVAFTAVLLHWRAGNELLALLCAVAVLVSVGCIMHTHREDGSAA